MARIYLEKEELRQHLKKVANEKSENELGKYFSNVCVKRYTKKEQDDMLEYLLYLIREVPGGYWQVVENMDYMPEFEHYKFRRTLSYEKHNVPKTVAMNELGKNYENYIEQKRKVYK